MARLIYLLLLISIPFKMVIGAKEDCSIRTRFRTVSSDVIQSFNKFSDNLRNFFRLPVDKIEHRRLKIKKAFYKFIAEATNGDSKRNNGSLSDYLNEDLDDIMLAPELIESHGYKGQSHSVITSDGYKLTLHRVLPADKNNTKSNNKIVLLHHGLLGSSCDWILLGKSKSLSYLLLDAGYDVWLANARGNKYSRDHISRIVDSKEYWDFSFHEIGIFDLSAVIDYIRLNTEGKSLIDFIGHSMGATALLVLLSTTPQYNAVLRSATLLGPLAFMYETKGPLRMLSEFQSKHGIDSLRFLGINEFMAAEPFPQPVIDKFCAGDEILCLNPWLLIANGGKQISDQNLKSNILYYVPAGGSTKTIIHFAQLIKSGQFQMFDMGHTNNLKLYGKRSPPTFRLNDVTVPVILISSKDDWLSTDSDIKSLLPHLPNPVLHHIIRKDGFSHTDFAWSQEAPNEFYYLIIDILYRFK